MVRKKLFPVAITLAQIVAAVSSFAAEPPETFWELISNGAGYVWGGLDDVDITGDGGTVSVGIAVSASDGLGTSFDRYNILAMKTDAGGAEEWKTIIYLPQQLSLTTISPTSDGGYLVAGNAAVHYDDDPFPYPGSIVQSYSNTFLLKLDSSGAELWRKYLNPSVFSAISDMQIADDGNLILAGISTYYISGNEIKDSPAVAKIGVDGEIKWLNRLDDDALICDAPKKIIQTSDGGYALASNSGCSSYGFDISKLDQSGNLVWTYSYFNQGYQANVQSLFEREDGGFAVAGGGAQIPNSDIYWWSFAWVSYRFDLDRYGNTNSNIIVEEPGTTSRCAFATSDGGLLVSADAHFRKINSTGAQEWILPHELSDNGAGYPLLGEKYAFDAAKAHDGGLVLAGSAGAESTIDGYQYNVSAPYLIRLGPGSDSPLHLDARLLVVGSYDGKVDFRRRKTFRVIVYGSAQLDTGVIDISTIRFGGAAPLSPSKGSRKGNNSRDFDGDGFSDLLITFATSDLAVTQNPVLTCRTDSLAEVMGESGIAVVKSQSFFQTLGGKKVH